MGVIFAAKMITSLSFIHYLFVLGVQHTESDSKKRRKREKLTFFLFFFTLILTD